MKESFKDFFTATSLKSSTDVNILHELKINLTNMGVFDTDDVKSFSDLFVQGASKEEWAPIIDRCAQRFNKEIEWADDEKPTFKMQCKQFVKIYSRMVAIMVYNVADWERLYWFLRMLIPELIVVDKEDDDLSSLLNSIDLNTYGARIISLNTHIELDEDESTLDPLKPVMVHAGGQGEEDSLDEIIKQFNEKYFKGWDATPDEQKAKLLTLAKQVVDDADYQLIEGNPDQQAVDKLMYEIIGRQVRSMRKGDKSFYKEYKDSEQFQYGLFKALNKIIENASYLAR